MPYGKGAAKAFKMATGSCQRSGLKSFKKGSAGDACRKKRAEGIAKTRKRR